MAGMGATKTPRFVAALLVCVLLLVQPRPITAEGDLFSKVVDTVSKYLSQDPNEAEKYSAAKDNAENMQHVHSRRVKYGADTWQATAIEFYERGMMQVQKYWRFAPTSYMIRWAKAALPRQVTNVLSSALSVAGDSALAAGNAAGAAGDTVTRAAASIGKTAADAIGGATGESFGDLHAKAQEGADALTQAAKAAGEKLHEAAEEARSEL